MNIGHVLGLKSTAIGRRDCIVYNIGGFVGAIAGGQALPLIFSLDGIGVYLRLLVASVLLFGCYGSRMTASRRVTSQ